MKPGHAAPESSSTRLCRGTRGAKQRHYCSVPLHNAAQTHQLGLRRGTAWHRIDIPLHHNFSCDCNVPAGDVSLGFWNCTFEGPLRNTTWEEIHWFHWLRPPAPLENLIHILFGLLSPSLQKKTQINQTPLKPMRKDTWMEARDGHKNRQSLDTAPKQCSWWDMKSQKRNDSLWLLSQGSVVPSRTGGFSCPSNSTRHVYDCSASINSVSPGSLDLGSLWYTAWSYPATKCL